MRPERWVQIKEVLADALSREPRIRIAWLQDRCQDDPLLRKEVETLLDSEADIGSFLESPAVAHWAISAEQTDERESGPEEGDHVNNYRISGFLGEGGMGKVLLARDTALHRPVALKFLSSRLRSDPRYSLSLIREARAAAALDHPYICKIYETGEFRNQPYIAMEYVEGVTLRARIGQAPIPAAEALSFATEIAEALEIAHEKGIVHRDLKPENVVVTKQGHVKVMDFGLARRFPTSDHAGKEKETEIAATEIPGPMAGTPPYMSPEQLSAGSVDARSDLFSLGVMFFEMLKGTNPFRRETPQATAAAILGNARPSLDGDEVPGGFEKVVHRLLARDPAQRYASVTVLLADLRRLELELSASTLPPPRRSGLRALEITLALMVMVGGMLALFFLLRDDSPAGIGVSGRPSIAVLPFQDHTRSEQLEWLSSGVPEMLLTGLAQVPGVDLISRHRVHEIAARMGADLLKPGEGLLSEIGRQAGAGAIVLGSVYRDGALFRIEVQMEDIATGRILSAHSVSGESMFSLVDDLAGRLRDGLNLTDIEPVRSVAEVTTASLSAFRFYSEGLEASRHLRVPEARRLLEKAIEIDPDFAMAYYHLALISEPGRSSALHAKVREHQGKLPERERLFVEALRSQAAHRFDEALQTLEELVTRFPDMEAAYLRMHNIQARNPDRQEQALAALEAGIRALPNSGALRNACGFQLLNMMRFEEAISQFRTYAELHPDEANSHDSLAEAFLNSGRPARAIEHYGRSLHLDPSFSYSHVGRSWAEAMLGRYDKALKDLETYLTDPRGRDTLQWPRMGIYQKSFLLSRLGRYREAAKLISKAALDSGESQANPVSHALSAWWAIERGDDAGALREARRFRQTIPSLSGLNLTGLVGQEPSFIADLLAGVAQARLGDTEAARKLLDSHEFDPRFRFKKWWHHALKGEIALAEGDLEAAEMAFSEGQPEVRELWRGVELFRTTAANNLPFRDGLARIRKAKGDLSGAIEAYRRLDTADENSRWTAALEPRYVLELARLLHQAGDRQAARAEYRRFLEFWKDADPDLPELAEARRYLSD